MNFENYDCYDSPVEYLPYKYHKGDGYYYSVDMNIKGLGFGYTEWFQSLSGDYECDYYYDINLIWNW